MFEVTAAVCRIEEVVADDTADSEVAEVGTGVEEVVGYIAGVLEVVAETAVGEVATGSLGEEGRETVLVVDRPCVPFVELG